MKLNRIFDLALNLSLSSLEQLLHRYTMESTIKPFDIRSVPIQAMPEPVKNIADISAGLPQGQSDSALQRENTYNGKFNRNIYLFIFYFNEKKNYLLFLNLLIWVQYLNHHHQLI